MGVYIDSMNARFGRMKMCHMMADTREELLEMADKIGVARKWIQYPGSEKEHFDVCLSAKKKALEAGAIEVGWRDIVAIIKAKKNALELYHQRHVNDRDRAVMYEDDLPIDMPEEDYKEWFKISEVIFSVRMGRVYIHKVADELF